MAGSGEQVVVPVATWSTPRVAGWYLQLTVLRSEGQSRSDWTPLDKCDDPVYWAVRATWRRQDRTDG